MGDITSSFMSLGVVGVVAGVLFKKFLDDSESDKEYFRAEIKETRELYKEELRKDREIYITCIEKITGRIDNIESDVKDIKETLSRREG